MCASKNTQFLKCSNNHHEPSHEQAEHASNEFDDFSLIVSFESNDEISNLLSDDDIQLYIADYLVKDNEAVVIKKIENGSRSTKSHYLVKTEEKINFKNVFTRHRKKCQFKRVLINIERIKNNRLVIHVDDYQKILKFYLEKELDCEEIKKIEKSGNDAYMIEFENKNKIDQVLKKAKEKNIKIQKVSHEEMFLSKNEDTSFINLNVTETPYSILLKSQEYIQNIEKLLKLHEANLVIQTDRLQVKYSSNKTDTDKLVESLNNLKKQYHSEFSKLFSEIRQLNDSLNDAMRPQSEKESEVDYLFARFLNERKDYLQNCLDNEKIECKIEICMNNRHEDLNAKVKILYRSHDRSDLMKAKKYIDDNFDHQALCLSLDYSDELYDQLLNHVPSLYEKYSEYLLYVLSRVHRKIYLAGRKGEVETMHTKIMELYEQNKVLDKSYPFLKQDLRFLQIVKGEHIEKVCQKIRKETNNNISIRFDFDKNCLEIRGKPFIHEIFNNEFKQMLVTREVENYTITDIDFIQSLDSEEIEGGLESIENKTKCLIKVCNNDPLVNNKVINKVDHIQSQARTLKDGNVIHQENILNVKINIVNDKIWNIKNVDAIVIASNPDLKPFDYASQVILDDVSEELFLEDIAAAEQFFEGQFHITHSGKLKYCKNIVHAVVPKNVDQKSELFILRNCIEAILSQCNDIHVSSIAIPIFYTNKFNDKIINSVIDFIREAILRYLNNTSVKNKIKEIFIIDDVHSELIAKVFKNYIDTAGQKARINFRLGSIFDIQDPVDAIVNTTNQDLNLRIGYISKLILSKAGDTLQEELKTLFPDGLEPRMVARSSAGEIPNVKYIYHIFLDNYENTHRIEMNFKDYVENILKKADQDGCESILFPAIGTGKRQYPKDKVADWMLKSIGHYFHRKHTNLKRVYISLANEEDVELFENHLCDTTDDELDETVDEIGSNSRKFHYKINFENAEKELKAELRSVSIHVTNKTKYKGTPTTPFNHIQSLLESKTTVEELELDSNDENKKFVDIIVLSLIRNRDFQTIVYNIKVKQKLKTHKLKKYFRKLLKGFAIFMGSIQSEIKAIKISIDSDLYDLFVHEMKKIANSGYSYSKAVKKMNKIRKEYDLIENQPKEMNKIITLELISDGLCNIASAREEIDSLINKTKSTIFIKNVEDLDDYELNDIKAKAKANNIVAEYDKDLSKMKLFGRTKSVHEFHSQALEYFHKIKEFRATANLELAKQVQWKYSSNQNTWYDFSLYLNSLIEDAYAKGKGFFEFHDDDEILKIDFKENIEINSNNEFKCHVCRTDMNRKLDIILPEKWLSIKSLGLVSVKPETMEYEEVLYLLNTKKFKGKIISIHRVQNLRLYTQYEAHKKHFVERDKNNVNERTLFHGTTGDSVEKIWEFGFNRSYCGKNATVYGRGVYFARDASYSHDYTNLGRYGSNNPSGNKDHAHLFICEVLVGYFKPGNHTIESKNLPKAPDGQSPVDSTVNNMREPTIFVIYHDAQAYPEYLITYQ